MWRRLAFVLPSVVLLGVGASTIETTDVIHHVQASERAAQAREGQRLDQLATGQREALQALQQATVQRDAAQAKVAELQPALDAANAKTNDLQGQLDQAKQQVTSLQAATVGLGAGPAAQTVGVTAGPALFPWGYCTWYVATRRAVSWTGNAIDWWWNAARAGRPEGSQPRVGAIQVSRDSIWGHVAYVEQVNGNGSWVVSEMNFVAWGYVDRRTVWPGGTLVGFIY